MRLCVIGDPVGHSLSPLLHRRMLDPAGFTGSYETATLPPDTLPAFLAAFMGVRPISDEEAKQIQALIDEHRKG